LKAYGPVAVVDDDESHRVSVRNLLASAGLRVALFPSAEALLASRELDEMSCLVLDLQLEGMSGLDLAAQLAASGVKLPFVVVSGVDNQEWEHKSLHAGAAAFLRKPFAPDELLAIVESMVARATA
jgi:FixJ family two-component response regulator